MPSGSIGSGAALIYATPWVIKGLSQFNNYSLAPVLLVVLVLVYVLRHHNEVRAISLRRASKQERKLYASWQETH